MESNPMSYCSARPPSRGSVDTDWHLVDSLESESCSERSQTPRFLTSVEEDQENHFREDQNQLENFTSSEKERLADSVLGHAFNCDSNSILLLDGRSSGQSQPGALVNLLPIKTSIPSKSAAADDAYSPLSPSALHAPLAGTAPAPPLPVLAPPCEAFSSGLALAVDTATKVSKYLAEAAAPLEDHLAFSGLVPPSLDSAASTNGATTSLLDTPGSRTLSGEAEGTSSTRTTSRAASLQLPLANAGVDASSKKKRFGMKGVGDATHDLRGRGIINGSEICGIGGEVYDSVAAAGEYSGFAEVFRRSSSCYSCEGALDGFADPPSEDGPRASSLRRTSNFVNSIASKGPPRRAATRPPPPRAQLRAEFPRMTWTEVWATVRAEVAYEIEGARAFCSALWAHVTACGDAVQDAVCETISTCREIVADSFHVRVKDGGDGRACSIWLAVGLGGVATLAVAALVGELVSNRRLQGQLRQRDRELARLVVKILGLQDSMQSIHRSLNARGGSSGPGPGSGCSSAGSGRHGSPGAPVSVGSSSGLGSSTSSASMVVPSTLSFF